MCQILVCLMILTMLGDALNVVSSAGGGHAQIEADIYEIESDRYFCQFVIELSLDLCISNY